MPELPEVGRGQRSHSEKGRAGKALGEIKQPSDIKDTVH